MKAVFVGWVLTCVVGSAACAEPVGKNEMSKERVQQIERDVFTLNYWSMLPPALMKRCETEYPDTLMHSRVGYMAWMGRHFDMAGRVETSRDLFSSMLAKARGQTQAAYEAKAKKMLDKEMVQGLFRDFSAADTKALCANLDDALGRILPDDFTRDSLLPALKNLETLREQLQK